MKIVIAISHSFCANFIRGQARYLKNRGCEVVIVSAPGPEVSAVADEEGARLVEIPFSREISLASDSKSLVAVIKFLRKEKPSIINAGNPKTGFLFMLAKLIFPAIPMIFTLRGLRSDTLSGLKKRVVTFTEWLSCYLADRVIVISPSLKTHAVQRKILNESKAIVLGKGSSNGVDVTKYALNDENQQSGIALRERLGVVNTFVIGYVGRITKDKGIEEVYEAFRICRSKHENIKLILTGPVENDDPLDEQLMTVMKDDRDVLFLGKTQDVTSVYAAYDLLVLYSYREGFGNVALEASSMQRPVIVSDIPGGRDTTEHMKSGIIVKPRDPEALAKALNIYIENPSLAIQHGAYGARRARDSFASEVIWDGQFKLYRQLIKR
ncbi:glycosyltransferase family 4 protein [Olivibacter sp. SDN3]|uniref:glycosyltransferase family 4 protein n=1 Tax=Olivibacter sp. SDN3 TaxID=2764720 RepID=UPI00165120AA|nr:glycosyltransferase family 4 protein [Olivibacter sp. SDN3]QNL51604.1 glycosyltransferase family 4 protein [Olivibacter sp. SDN3]